MIALRGYCMQEACDQFNRGTMLLPSDSDGSNYYCSKCRFKGYVEQEHSVDYAPPGEKEPKYQEVRVYFSFDAYSRKYKECVVLRIEDIEDGWRYELYSPAIISEKTAFRRGEALLCSLNSGRRDGNGYELLLDFDKDRTKFSESCKKLEEILADRDRRLYARS